MSFLELFFGIKPATDYKIDVLSVAEYTKKISEKNVQLVDVRTAREYTSGHIKNAVNIDYYSSDFLKKTEATFKKDLPLYIYCRSGARSMQAARKLAAMGFAEIYDLKGGILAWK
ncbi:rhodanese-like domain-containing protein [Abyssalbus ytuae]|uniref:Rhodanese-like domain-containing protein n=1 Tax=Abyssalbus ytuae TaxID=2926907 RepID=A0A9E7CYB1_9FLAO|nr:rhodanese-like domain-containing protein [Abyssalbus ytuae]UOB16465.1 rhodanese-like domain-containing protein [Abyssalbus ytuae]